MGTEIVFREESYRIMGACFEKATGKQLGILVNFGHYPKIEHERFVNQSFSCVSRVS